MFGRKLVELVETDKPLTISEETNRRLFVLAEGVLNEKKKELSWKMFGETDLGPLNEDAESIFLKNVVDKIKERVVNNPHLPSDDKRPRKGRRLPDDKAKHSVDLPDQQAASGSEGFRGSEVPQQQGVQLTGKPVINARGKEETLPEPETKVWSESLQHNPIRDLEAISTGKRPNRWEFGNGKTISVDAQTANLLTTVHAALAPIQRKTFVENIVRAPESFQEMVDFSYRLVRQVA